MRRGDIMIIDFHMVEPNIKEIHVNESTNIETVNSIEIESVTVTESSHCINYQ